MCSGIHSVVGYGDLGVQDSGVLMAVYSLFFVSFDILLAYLFVFFFSFFLFPFVPFLPCVKNVGKWDCRERLTLTIPYTFGIFHLLDMLNFTLLGIWRFLTARRIDTFYNVLLSNDFFLA